MAILAVVLPLAMRVTKSKKGTKQYEIGQVDSSYPDSPKALYHVACFEGLNLVFNAIKADT